MHEARTQRAELTWDPKENKFVLGPYAVIE
jgi:hypothetical protein